MTVTYLHNIFLYAATPIHDGMRTPMRDRAWNPYTPMSPARYLTTVDITDQLTIMKASSLKRF